MQTSGFHKIIYTKESNNMTRHFNFDIYKACILDANWGQASTHRVYDKDREKKKSKEKKTDGKGFRTFYYFT